MSTVFLHARDARAGLLEMVNERNGLERLYPPIQNDGARCAR